MRLPIDAGRDIRSRKSSRSQLRARGNLAIGMVIVRCGIDGLSASNHDHPHPSPHNGLPGCVPLLSLTMTNQP